jgi:hypothetical protein
MSDLGTTPTGRKRTKPNLVHVNVRLPKHVVEFYRQYPNYTSKMRSVLMEFAAKQQTES